MMKWKRIAGIVGVVFFFSATADSAFAREEKEVPTMETVVVTGTRSEQKIRRIPANVTVIGQERISNSNAKNVAELLRSEQGIVVRDALGNGKTAQVDLRGFGETGPFNTLVLVDGRRVNPMDLSGVDWTQIPLEQIERIEVVRGTGTVLYGDNAVGGVIHIITKLPAEEFAFSSGVQAGSYGRSEAKVGASGRQGKLGGALFASYDSTNGYRDNSELRTKDVGGKLLFDAADFLGLNVSGSYHSDDYGLPGALSEAEMDRDRKSTNSPFDEAETTDGHVRVGADVDLGRFGSLVSDISYRERETDWRWQLYGIASESRLRTWSFTPRYILDGEIAGHGNKLIAGADLYWSEQDVKNFNIAPAGSLTGIADIERDSLGLYVNDEFDVLDNLILSAGVRRERVDYDLSQEEFGAFALAPLDDSVKDTENAFSAGLTFLYGIESSVFVRANRSLRFPLTDELVLYDFAAGRLRVNSDLVPQTGLHYEAGVKHSFSPQFEMTLTLFRMEIEDEIFFNPVTFTNENHPETLHQGVEIGARAEPLDFLTVFGNYVYEKATFEAQPFNGNDIPAAPRHKGSLGFRIHDLMPGWNFTAGATYVGSSYAISDQGNAFKKVDNYTVVDARISYEWRKIKAFFGVNNITDEQYSEYVVIGGFPSSRQFYPAPERNWVAGLEFTF